MQQIIALFKVFIPYLSTTLGRQLSHIVFAQLAMTGRVTMLNISRWTSKGGSYRTGQRFFNTVCARGTTLFWVFFRTHLFDRESDYILVADETVTPKIRQKNTYGFIPFLFLNTRESDPQFVILSRVHSECQGAAFLSDGYRAKSSRGRHILGT